MNTFIRSALLVGTGIAAGAAITVSPWALAEKNEAAQTLPIEDIQLFADVFGSIKNYYVDEVSDSKLIEYAIKGMVSELDTHSSYLDKKAFKDLEESTMGEFGGLGIEVTKDPQGVLVVSPIDDTPAARAGVLAGDIIVKLDGKSTADLSLNQNVKLMRGKPGTKIRLTIARKGTVKPLVIEITRAIIKVRSVKSKALANNLGYIRISQFQEHTWEDVASALQKLNASGNLKGLVLDLRNNPGGLLDAAIGVCAAFLPQGSLKTALSVTTGLVSSLAIGALFAVAYSVPSQLAADEEEKTGVSNSAMYFAVQGLFSGVATGIGANTVLTALKGSEDANSGAIRYMTLICALGTLISFALTFVLPKSITGLGKEK